MCNCADIMNDRLRQYNFMLSRNLLQENAPALVEISKIERKKRTPSISLIASYCPFCGEKYPERGNPRGRGVLKSAASEQTA